MSAGANATPRERPPAVVAGLDPGRSKCGLVLADTSAARIRAAAILPPEAAMALLAHWHRHRHLARVVIGDGTGGRPWPERLGQLGLTASVVDERGTTLAARERFWDLEPPPLHLRLLPRGLRQPGRDIDDVVAQLLLERWLGVQLARSPMPVLRSWPEHDGQASRSGPAR